MTNNGPISVTSILKDIWTLIPYQIVFLYYKQNLLYKHNLMCRYQFGFRNGCGTNLPVIALVDKFPTALENGKFVLR